MRVIAWVIVFPILVILGGVGYVGLRVWWTGVTWHEAVTLEVDAPMGVKTGRSVISFSLSEDIVPGGSSLWTLSRGYAGEATVIEVAPGQFLFALLRSEKDPYNRPSLAQAVFPEIDRDRETKELSDTAWMQLFTVPRAKREIPREALPLLVRLRDIKDPKTVEKVDPANLAASFGPGFSLKSATLEMLGKRGQMTKGEVEKVVGPIWGGS
ncbi:MAG: hypothetical protein O9333_05120 [Beijerinckiaceae bacterium]|nr:hypothetical protein [Beijerinckiaceae bacterium]